MPFEPFRRNGRLFAFSARIQGKSRLKPFLQYGPYVAIDFETSANSGARACAIGMARMENLEVAATWYSLIRPQSNRIQYTYVHGLTWSDLRDAPSFEEILPEITAFIKGAKFLIAHNASFDSRVLADCCSAYELPRPRKPFLCTLRGARWGLSLSSYSLDSVCRHFGIVLKHHHAASDAIACGKVHARLLKLGVKDSQMLLGNPVTQNRRKSA